MRRLVVAFALALPATAHAQATVEVMLNGQGEDLAADLGLSVPELIATAEARIDELYRVSRIDQLLRSFANTAAFAQRGLGADYDVDPGDIFVGVGATAVHGDVAIGTTNELLGGSTYSFSLLTGANLARWQQPRWTVFASGAYNSTTIYGLDGDLIALGAHAQYQLVQPTRRANARWTGVAATAGLEYARWSVGTSSSLESHFDARGPAEHATVHMSSTGTLDVLTRAVSVPLEVTTGARLLGVLSVYAGGGISLTTGDSTINAELNSLLTINADRLPIGTAVITGAGENTPSTAAAHALAGLAIHTRHVRVFLQGAVASGEVSVGLGVRVVP